MFLLTLRVTAHHLEEIAAFRALELIDRHGADPPGTSHRVVAYKTTLFPSPARGGGSGWGRNSPPTPGEGQGGGCACKGEHQREYPKQTANDRSQPSDSSFQVDGGETNAARGDQSREPDRRRTRSASLA